MRSGCILVVSLLAGCFTDSQSSSSGQSSDGSGGTTTTLTGAVSQSTTGPTAGATSSAGPTTAGSGDELCPDGFECAFTPPEWLGVVVADGGGCLPGFGEFGVFEAEPDVMCTCDCAPPPEPCALMSSLGGACDALSPVAADTCVAGTGGETSMFQLDFAPIACEGTGTALEVATTTQELCAPEPMALGCGDRNWCSPPGAACVARLGDHLCPVPYTSKSIISTAWTLPACATPCGDCAFECGPVQVHDSTGCTGASTPIQGDGACVVHGIFPYGFFYDAAPTCVVEQPDDAFATPDQPTTLCCQ